MFWGFPQRLRLQRWLIENPAPGAQKGGASGYFPALTAHREPTFWVRTHFASQLRRNSVLTPTRIFLWTKDHFLSVLRPFLSSQCLMSTQSTLEAQPLREVSKHFWEIWMEWGSNLSLFFFQEQMWKLKFYEKKRLWCVIYFSHSFWMTLYIYILRPKKMYKLPEKGGGGQCPKENILF